MEKTLKLNKVFIHLKETGSSVKVGDLIKEGASVELIKAMAKDYNAYLIQDASGVTVVTFNQPKEEK